MENTKITYNANEKIGKIKAMHGVGQPPIIGLDYSYMHYLKDAHIPYSRLHDVGGWFGGNMYVDIPNIFRDFSADVEDPASYDFVFTDRLLSELMKNGCEPYFRLGVTIENFHEIKAYRIFPPADFNKWARICEHIIRHYNEGWADGFHYNIQYWEIWNEPEDGYDPAENPMWKGTPEEFFDLYRVTSLHLRKCFGNSIKIGAYGACENAGVVEKTVLNALERGEGANVSDIKFDHLQQREYDRVDFLRRFTKMVADENLPFDFFSHHSYNSVKNTIKMQKFAEEIMAERGLENVEYHLNEWNPAFWEKTRGTSFSAAMVAAMMCGMHNTKANIMCYYDARIGIGRYAGLFNASTYEPYCTYYSLKAFGELYVLGTQIKCECDNPSVYTLAATNGSKNGILISNIGKDTVISMNCKNAKVYLIDSENMMQETDADLSNFLLKEYQVLYVEENLKQ